MKNKATLLNMISGMVLQFFTLVSGFILPKIILTCFGSEVNGLVSSLNQFLSYITLVEGGITGVIIANLYKPIVEQDNNKISSVLVTADRFYKKIGALFIGYSVVLSVVFQNRVQICVCMFADIDSFAHIADPVHVFADAANAPECG